LRRRHVETRELTVSDTFGGTPSFKISDDLLGTAGMATGGGEVTRVVSSEDRRGPPRMSRIPSGCSAMNLREHPARPRAD
jgi:hypothetical protein